MPTLHPGAENSESPFPPLARVLDPCQLETDEPAWTYPSSCAGGGGIALLRVWRTADGGHVAMVTENGIGVSITNAAEEIAAKLSDRYNAGPLVVLEHYRAGDGDDHERLDQVVVPSGGSARWRAVWPVPPRNPDYAAHLEWMRDCGHALLTARA